MIRQTPPSGGVVRMRGRLLAIGVGDYNSTPYWKPRLTYTAVVARPRTADGKAARARDAAKRRIRGIRAREISLDY